MRERQRGWEGGWGEELSSREGGMLVDGGDSGGDGGWV